MRTLGCGRRAPRKVVDLACSTTPRLGRKRRFRITEMSALGAWLPTTKPLPAGERFELRVPLPGSDSQRFTVKAEVMWTRTSRGGRGAGMGVEFVNLATEAGRQLSNALAGCPEAVGDGAPYRFTDAV